MEQLEKVILGKKYTFYPDSQGLLYVYDEEDELYSIFTIDQIQKMKWINDKDKWELAGATFWEYTWDIQEEIDQEKKWEIAQFEYYTNQSYEDFLISLYN